MAPSRPAIFPEQLGLVLRGSIRFRVGGRRDPARLRQKRFRAGDVILLQGRTSALADAMTKLGCLPLAERNLAIGRPRSRYLPLVILLGALVLIATGVLQVETGFFVAATLVLLLRLIPVREAYDAIDWPVIVSSVHEMPCTPVTAPIAVGITAVST